MKKYQLIALIISILMLSVWGLFFGFHFGWIDDIQDLNVMKGTFVNGCSIFDPEHFVFLQNILQFLYQLIPAFPWFGTLLYILLGYSLYLSVVLILSAPAITSQSLKICLSALFCICFLLESVNAINFTEVAILTSGITLIHLYYLTQRSKISVWKTLLYLIPWLVAMLIRSDVVFYTTGIILLLCFAQIPRQGLKKHIKSTGLVLFSAIALIIYVNLYLDQTANYKHINAFNYYLRTIQDAYQTDTSTLKTAEDSLIFESIVTWNYFDKYKFNIAFLHKISFTHPLRIEVLNDIPSRSRMLYHESFKYHGYHELYNWYWKLIFVLLINLLLMGLLLKNSRFRSLQILSSQLLFWILIFAVGIFVKMENRFFYPLCACYTLLNLLSALDERETDISRGKRIVTLLIFSIFSAWACIMVKQNIVMARELNDELKLKHSFWAELSRLKDKILVYDFHALLLLPDAPFKEVSLPANNENIVANHFYLTHFDCLNDYYKARIGTDSIDRIFDYLHNNREKVYLISHDYDIDFLQRYMHTVYHRDYYFCRDLSFKSAGQLHHNYIWMPLSFGVYRFKE